MLFLRLVANKVANKVAKEMPNGLSQWGMMLILVLLCSCFGFAFQPLGQKYLKAENAAVLTVVNPLTASILGIMVVGETLTGIKMIGYV